MAGKFSVEAIFKAVDRVSAPVRRMQDRVQRFTEGARRGLRDLGTVADNVVTGFRNIAGAAVAAAAVMGAALGEVIRVGAEFEQTMMRAVAKFGGIERGTEAFEGLRQAAEDVGATTEFDAQQAAGALEVYAAAGFSAEQAIASLAGAGDLATVSGLSLDEAARTAADSLGALGLTSEDAAVQARNLARVNDVLARTSSMVNTSATDMAEAIKAGGNITVQSGQSIETFGAMVAAMAQSNIKGAEAGTAIRNVLLRLQAPASRGARALRSLGVEVADSQGNMRDMVDVLGDLSRATASMGTQEKNEVLSHLFGSETITPALALLNAGADGLAAFRTELNEANGAAGQMAATMRDTAMGDIDGFTSAIDGVKTAIFNVVAGPFRSLLQSLTEWVNANREVVTSGVQEFLTWFAENLPEIAKWGRRIAIVAGVFLSVATAIKTATAAMTLFNFIAMMNPISLIAMAVIAAIALIIAFWPEISAFFSDLWDGTQDMAERVSSAVGGFMARVWGPVKEFLVGVFEFVVGAARLTLGPMFDVFVSGARWIMDNWGPISAFFGRVWESIAAQFEERWNRIVGFATTAFEILKAIWEPLAGYFSALWDYIVADFTAKFGGITSAVGWVVDQVRGVGRDTLDGDDDEAGAAGGGGSGRRPAPQVVNPAERTARTISESTTTNRSEVVIRDETGRAEQTRRPRGGANIRLEPSGAF
jgi:TP901 family phage tail tape measure protein